jgi:hypothetical protein
MVLYTVSDSQRKAARVVGFTYLLAMVTANFAEVYVLPRLVVHNDTAKTAANILAHERLFRLGIASDLMTFATDVVLIAALYVVLKPVNQNLALLATLWRLIETSLCVVMTLSSFDVLRLLSGSASLQVWEPSRLQALARLSLGAHGDAFNVCLLFFGLGSAVFSYLWVKSNYIPRVLAVSGVFSSLLVAICSFAFVVFPRLVDTLGLSCYVPIFIFELTMGFWLVIKKLRQPDQLSPTG